MDFKDFLARRGGGHSRLTSHIKGFGATHVATCVNVSDIFTDYLKSFSGSINVDLKPSPAFVTFADAHEQLLPLTEREGNSFTDKVFSRFTSHFSPKQVAFTLAEVLITLGIIGVVAALTLPTLIANYRNQAYVTQLEKTVSMLEQGFKKVLADEGVDNLEHTVLFSSIEGDSYGQLLDFTSNDGKNFVDGMKKYFNIINVNTVYADTYGGGKAANGGALYFSDGSSISGYFKSTLTYGNYGNDCEQYKAHGVNFCGFIGFFTIDVNGDKKPNIMGKDKFAFDLSDNARLIPVYGKEFSNFYGGYAPYWRTNSSSCGVPGEKINISTNSSYAGCAARIIENGWKIDYL